MQAGVLAVLWLAAAAGGAAAADRALVLANADYALAADLPGAAAATRAVPLLQAGGFAVVAATDLDTAGLRGRLSEMLGQLAPGDRLVILLAGHFVTSGAETWFLGTEAARPDLATAGAAGISLATVLRLAAEVPGGAVVLLGTEARRLDIGRGLAAGIGPLAVPQGVTVVRGDAPRVADFAARQITRRGLSLPQMLAAVPGLTAEGFLAPQPFRPDAITAPPPVSPAPAPTPPAPPPPPDDPAAQARANEASLGLTRDQRRAIQRQLSLLGFDPRGIDGLFGPGSRAAITAWQRANDEAANGFLTREQILRLTAQADRRAAELEAEAAARRAERDREDRRHWDQTGAAGDEGGLRAYLRRHPDGLFAELAQARLEAIEAERRAQAAAADRAAWDRARAADTVSAYRDYLAAFPRGAFLAEAEARIEALSAPALPEADRARAEAAEAALNLGPLARRLIEARLEALAYSPGPADGIFDAATRRAIRRFQAARGLPETGYLDQSAMVALLAGGVITLGD